MRKRGYTTILLVLGFAWIIFVRLYSSRPSDHDELELKGLRAELKHLNAQLAAVVVPSTKAPPPPKLRRWVNAGPEVTKAPPQSQVQLERLNAKAQKDAATLRQLQSRLLKLRADAVVRPPAPAPAMAAPPPATPPAPSEAAQGLEESYVHYNFHNQCAMLRQHEVKAWGADWDFRLGSKRKGKLPTHSTST